MMRGQISLDMFLEGHGFAFLADSYGPEPAFGENEVSPENGHDYEGERCDIKCLKAVHERCRCRCGGRNHGAMVRMKNSRLDDSRYYLSLGHDPEIRKLFDRKRCLSCGHDLTGAEILAYEHDGGVYYEPYRMRLWIFARCPRCGYDSSLAKIARLMGP